MYSFTMENNNFYFYKCQNVTSNKLIRQSGYKCITCENLYLQLFNIYQMGILASSKLNRFFLCLGIPNRGTLLMPAKGFFFV